MQVKQFLRALNYAANTVAELSGGPLTERRFLLDFPARAQAASHPDYTATMFNLVGASHVEANTLSSWLPEWKAAFLAASENSKVDPCIHTARLNYYEKAMEALLAGDTPLTALWPLIHTWTLAANVLNEKQSKSWNDACQKLGLLGASFDERLAGLDKYLDEIEVRLDEIATANGLETSNSL
jgi:hypothetical protein